MVINTKLQAIVDQLNLHLRRNDTLVQWWVDLNKHRKPKAIVNRLSDPEKKMVEEFEGCWYLMEAIRLELGRRVIRQYDIRC